MSRRHCARSSAYLLQFHVAEEGPKRNSGYRKSSLEVAMAFGTELLISARERQRCMVSVDRQHNSDSLL